MQVTRIEFSFTILALFLAFSEIYSFESNSSVISSSAITSGLIKQMSGESQKLVSLLLGVLPVIISPISFHVFFRGHLSA